MNCCSPSKASASSTIPSMPMPPAPRLCVQFSEQLTAGKFDYSKFVSINGTDPKAIVVEGSQLCVEGLAHGERYAVQLRSGLPSGIDESLLNTADLSVYVRDRAPQARFTGRNYVLPNKGQQGIPLVSVNTEKVNVEVFRIGDRGLARAVVAGDVQNQLSGDALETLRNQTGVSIWKGELPVKLTQNQEVTTAFPVSDVIAELSPGVYVMIAEPNGGKSDYWSARATQWFVVSDLGLTALSGQDGVNVFVRSLETAQPVAGSKVKLVARNNDVLGEAVSDGNGYARFDGGLARGKGGAEPAVLVAETPTGDYAFLDLTSSAFDLTDRGVSGRAAPAGLDAFVVTERGVYRPGESVYFTALLRDDRQLAVTGIPLTLVISRPDGVEQRRDVLADMGLGGRSFTFATSKSAMTGTWRARIYADPQGQALAETSFLVEDFLPERIDLQLATTATALPIGSAWPRQGHRPLPLRSAGGGSADRGRCHRQCRRQRSRRLSRATASASSTSRLPAFASRSAPCRRPMPAALPRCRWCCRRCRSRQSRCRPASCCGCASRRAASSSAACRCRLPPTGR